MRPTHYLALFLALGLFGGSIRADLDDGPSIEMHTGTKVPRLPVLPRDAWTWITLHETRMKPLPAETPLGEVIQKIKEAARGEDGKQPGIEIYLDPKSMKENPPWGKIALDDPLVIANQGTEAISLEKYLSAVAKELHLEHRVRNGVVVISWQRDWTPPFQTATAAEARTWLLLHQEVPLKYPKEMPLREVLDGIRRLGHPGARGLVIVVDEKVAKDEEKPLDTKVSIDLEHTPLCTSLALVLNQARLCFSVRDDGALYITKGFGDRMDAFDVFAAYRVDSWLNEVRMEQERLKERAGNNPEEDAQRELPGKGGFRPVKRSDRK